MLNHLKKLPFQIISLNCLLLFVAGVFVAYFPGARKAVSEFSTATIPIFCGILVGAIGVLSTIVVAIYSTIVDLKPVWGPKGYQVLTSLGVTIKEIRQDSMLAITIAAISYAASVFSPALVATAVQLGVYDQLAVLKAAILLYISCVMFWLAIDVVKSMFTLLDVAHAVYVEKYTKR